MLATVSVTHRATGRETIRRCPDLARRFLVIVSRMAAVDEQSKEIHRWLYAIFMV
jgi:hypothetical protein